MKNYMFNTKLVLVGAMLILGSCADDDIAQIGDLIDLTGPTPSFDFSEITESQFDCNDVLQFADYELSLEAGSNLAVNGTQYEWTISEIVNIDAEGVRTLEPVENLGIINSNVPVFEALIDEQMEAIVDLEEDIVDVELSLPCAEDADETTELMTELSDLQDLLAAAMADQSEEVAAVISDLESQLANLPEGTVQDRNIVASLPGPGLYNVRLTVTDDNGVSDFVDQEILVAEAVPSIPIPEILEPSFELGNDSRDPWRAPSNAAWSPTTGGTTVLQINTPSNPVSAGIPDGVIAGKFPIGADRVAYQEIDVTPGASYTLFYFNDFDEGELIDMTLRILRPETSSYAEAIQEANILASRTDNNDGRVRGSFRQSAISFDAEEHESVIIYLTGTGAGEKRFDAFSIIVNE